MLGGRGKVSAMNVILDSCNDEAYFYKFVKVLYKKNRRKLWEDYPVRQNANTSEKFLFQT